MRVRMLEPQGRGGLQYYARSLAEALVARGHQVHVLTTTSAESRDGDGGVRYTRRVEGFTEQVSWPTPLRKARSAALHVRNWERVRREMSRPDADVAHFVTEPKRWADACLGRVSQERPTVLTVHNVLPHDCDPRVMVPYWGRIYRAMDALACHHDASVAELERLFGSTIAAKATVVRFPVDDDPWAGAAPLSRSDARLRLGLPDAPSILFFGAIRPYKGLGVLLDAMPEITSRIPSARLVIAGECADWEPYRARIAQLGISESVIARPGWVDRPDIPRYFAAADVIGLPYTRIDASAVAAVAASMDVPMVVSDIPGFRAMWRDDEALFAAPDPHAWAEALVVSLTEPVDAGARAKRAHERADAELSWSTGAARYQHVYELAIERFGAR